MKEKTGNRDMMERTFEFSRRVIRLVGCLDCGTVSQTLGRQVLRSGTSIGANYREADKARSKAEFISKVGDCLKESAETCYWLELMEAERISKQEILLPLIDESRQILAILTTIKRNAERNP